MGDNLEEKSSFLRRQWEAYKLVDETVRNKSLLQDFIASDPVNGLIVKATQDTRAKAHIPAGIFIFGPGWRYVWKNRNSVHMGALIVLLPFAAHVTLDLAMTPLLDFSLTIHDNCPSVKPLLLFVSIN